MAGCNDLTVSGDAVKTTAGVGSAPTPAGGTIMDGTYLLTKVELYPPSYPAGPWGKETLRITGSKMEDVVQAAFASTSETATYSISTAGTALMFTQICPTPMPNDGGVTPPYYYTATATTFIQMSGSFAWTYTRH